MLIDGDDTVGCPFSFALFAVVRTAQVTWLEVHSAEETAST
jgi:hypothetical protein